jgi:hypothetical protein
MSCGAISNNSEIEESVFSPDYDYARNILVTWFLGKQSDHIERSLTIFLHDHFLFAQPLELSPPSELGPPNYDLLIFVN